MILPNGTQVTVSNTSNPDIFFAIKGGGNKFGVIYNFKLFTVPQTDQIYGGLRLYGSDQLQNIINATYEFAQNNKDPKAQVLPTFNYDFFSPGAIVLAFYDGPNPPAGTFAAFDQATPTIDLWKTQTFSGLVGEAPSDLFAGGRRGAFHSVSLNNFSLSLLQQTLNQTNYWGGIGNSHSAAIISYDVEPFLAGWGVHDSKGAYPHTTSPLPLNLYFAWTDASQDQFYANAIVESSNLLKAQAEAEGQDLSGNYIYPNYAITGTPAGAMYGATNAARLESIRKSVDPNDVMGLTTYFSFTS